MKQYNESVITFGGKTGQFQLLDGLKKLNEASKITAIVGTWDSGGSSGVLRTELGVLPPGDIRACILALMENDEQQKVAQRLFDDRLQEVSGPLKGHSLGNLIGVRLDHLFHGQDRGTDAERALFRISAKILPATLTDLQLMAETSKGLIITGESNIDLRVKRRDYDSGDKIVRIYFDTRADINPETLESIKKADKIVFSPGDLYTSVLPHLLVDGVREAINTSKAKLILVLNLATKAGETDNFKASDFLKSFVFYLDSPNRLDYMIINDNHLDQEVVDIYNQEGQHLVEFDEDECRKIAPRLKVVKKPVAVYLKKEHLLRHDSVKIAKAILDL